MGQRVCILLKKNLGNNKSTITLIHHQWGIGKVMPSLFLQEVMKYAYPIDRSLEYLNEKELKEKNKLPIDFFFTFEPLNNEYSNYFTDKEVATDDPNEDIWKREVRIRYGNMTDNNNGMMLVEVTQNYRGGEPINYGSGMLSVKVGFCLGYEETAYWQKHMKESIHIEPDFDRLVSMEEYACRTYGGENSAIEKYTKDYIKSCRKIMEVVDVKEVYDKNGKRKRNAKEKHIKNCIDALTKDLPEGVEIDVPAEFKEEKSLYV